MRALNILRAVLVACAFVAAVLLAFQGDWLPAGVMGLGVLAHVALWGYLMREKRRHADDPLHELTGSAPAG